MSKHCIILLGALLLGAVGVAAQTGDIALPNPFPTPTPLSGLPGATDLSPAQAAQVAAELGKAAAENNDAATPKAPLAKAPEAKTPREAVPQPTPDLPTEFQRFVAGSLGHNLPLFGYNLFTSVPSTFAQADRIPVTDEYPIGPGDEILVRVWGQIDFQGRVTVDRSGDIYLTKVGSIHVAGLQYHQLQDYLKSAVARIYKNFDLTVNLGQLRSIQVFVVGQARRPGAYTVSSLSTLVNALFACGGPSPAGSMRHIQLKRDNRVVTEFDIYDLLLKGDKSKDVVLQPGDVIFIPPAGPQVAVDGSVNVPAVYELKVASTLRGPADADAGATLRGPAIAVQPPSAAILGNLLELAGGLTSVATGQYATIERIDGRTTRKVDQFPLDEVSLARPLQDADLIRIYSVSPKFENAVTLRGNVARPGRYPWHPGMRVRDLIPARESLITRDYWLHQNDTGRDDFWRRPNAARRNASQLGWDGTDSGTEGDARDQSSLPPNPADREKEIKGLPDINWDYALVSRLGSADLSNRLIPFALGKAIDDAASPDNLELQAGDIVTIFSQADIRVAVNRQSKFVQLEGELQVAGIYRLEPGETLRHLVARVGGLTPQAYLFGSEFTRESTRVEQQARLDEIVQQLQRDAQRNAALLSIKAASPDSAGTANSKIQPQNAMLGSMKQLKATGRIVLNVRPDDKSVDALPELVLEDGDRFYVPNRSSTISVAGEVMNPSTFLYEPWKRTTNYLRQAGGVSQFADQGRMFILRANGAVISKKTNDSLWSSNFARIQLMPGDAIVVPEQLPRLGIMTEIKDWAQIISQFGLGAAAIEVLK
jgi:protein involved in polysaccharide export with SLBB domain